MSDDYRGWKPASVGCRWTNDSGYSISTCQGGDEPSGYIVYHDRQQLGRRYPSFALAVAAVSAHIEGAKS